MMLNGNDTHLDDYFQSLSPSHVFLWVLEQHGLIIGWDHQIKDWIKDIYGIDLDEIAEQSIKSDGNSIEMGDELHQNEGNPY